MLTSEHLFIIPEAQQPSFDSRVSKCGLQTFFFRLQIKIHPQFPSFESEPRASVDQEGVKALTEPRFHSGERPSTNPHHHQTT